MIGRRCRLEGPRRRRLLDNRRFPAAAWPSSRPEEYRDKAQPAPGAARHGGSRRSLSCRRPAGNWQPKALPTPVSTPDPAALETRRRRISRTRRARPQAGPRCGRFDYYPRLRCRNMADRSRGPVRGPARRIIPAQRVLPVRLPMASLQLARLVHEAVLLVNGRSSPPDPGLSQQARLAFFVVA